MNVVLLSCFEQVAIPPAALAVGGMFFEGMGKCIFLFDQKRLSVSVRALRTAPERGIYAAA